MSSNPLFDQLKQSALNAGGTLSYNEAKSFINNAIGDLNNLEMFDDANPSRLITNYKAISLYASTIDGVYTGNIVADISARSGGAIL